MDPIINTMGVTEGGGRWGTGKAKQGWLRAKARISRGGEERQETQSGEETRRHQWGRSEGLGCKGLWGSNTLTVACGRSGRSEPAPRFPEVGRQGSHSFLQLLLLLGTCACMRTAPCVRAGVCVCVHWLNKADKILPLQWVPTVLCPINHHPKSTAFLPFCVYL